jgi:hypothetical protein
VLDPQFRKAGCRDANLSLGYVDNTITSPPMGTFFWIELIKSLFVIPLNFGFLDPLFLEFSPLLALGNFHGFCEYKG